MKYSFHVCSVLIMLLSLFHPPSLMAQDQPVALLLCNWKYQHLTPLLTPEADVEAMKAVLEAHNPPFKVTVVANGTKEEMQRTIEEFSKKHAGNPVVLVYASGHGLNVGGVNYLTGVETNLTEFEAQAQTLRKVFPSDDAFRAQVLAAQRHYAEEQLVSVESLMGRLGEMSPPELGDEHVKMVFLDACREPFPEVNEGAGSLVTTKTVFGGKSAGGLARVSERPGIFVGMSAAANQVAQQSDRARLAVRPELLDNVGSMGRDAFLWDHYHNGGKASDLIEGALPPSFFTERLAEEISRGGGLEQVFNRTGAAVRRDSRELQAKGLMSAEQTPAKYSLYYGGYKFCPNATSPTETIDSLRSATKNLPYINSIGLSFIPIPGLSGVWMSTTEVRLSDYKKFSNSTGFASQKGSWRTEFFEASKLDWEYLPEASWENPGFKQNDQHPVVCITWHEAKEFCQWLSTSEFPLRYRMPNEAEWRAATGTQHKYPWGKNFPPPKNYSNYHDVVGVDLPSDAKSSYREKDNFEFTSEVKSFPPNENGFFDLFGNAAEWGEDIYRARLNDVDVAAKGGLAFEMHNGSPMYSIRGACWRSDCEYQLRTSYRDRGHPAAGNIYTGFRVVIEVAAFE